MADAEAGAPPDPATLRAALGLIECLPLGEARILHNRESGAIVASNAFGAMLLEHLRAAPGVEAAVQATAAALEVPEGDVRGAVEGTLARWADDGLFLTAQRPFPVPIPYRPVETGDARAFGHGANAVTLRSEDPGLLDDIDRALAPMELTAGARGSAPVRLEVIDADQVYGAFRDGVPLWGAAGYELTRFHLLREIMDVLCGPERVSAHLHASAMAVDGAGLVFAGASGSGKSTLATLLLGLGAALAADDHVAVDVSGEALLAFPTRPNLKPGALELPAMRAVVAAQGGGAAEFVPKARLRVGAAVRLAGFVFPRYDPDGANRLSEVAPEAALRRLIQTGSRVSRSTRSLAPLLHALNTRPCRDLVYSDTGFAVSQCLGLLAR